MNGLYNSVHQNGSFFMYTKQRYTGLTVNILGSPSLTVEKPRQSGMYTLYMYVCLGPKLPPPLLPK